MISRSISSGTRSNVDFDTVCDSNEGQAVGFQGGMSKVSRKDNLRVPIVTVDFFTPRNYKFSHHI